MLWRHSALHVVWLWGELDSGFVPGEADLQLQAQSLRPGIIESIGAQKELYITIYKLPRPRSSNSEPWFRKWARVKTIL